MAGMRWVAAVVASVLVLSGCTSGERPDPEPAPPAGTVGGGERPAGNCPVSRPSPHAPRPPSPDVRFVNGEYIPGNSNGYGNADLWAGLPVNGELVTQRTHDGYAAMMGWWQVHTGTLKIAADALDGPSDGFTARVRTTGYSGRTGYRVSRLVFPARGCWRVTGRMHGRAPLALTVHVSDARPSRPAPSPTSTDDEWHVKVS